MKRFLNKEGSSRLYSFYFIHGLIRKIARFRHKSYKFNIFLPSEIKKNKDFDIYNELKSFIPDKDLGSSISKSEQEHIIEQADKILENKFSIFGVEDIVLDPVPWSKDINSGFEWPKGSFFSDYKQVDLTNDADVKYPRELSRSHFLLYLGQAYLLTKNEGYALKIVSLISDWTKENPFMRCINWGCTMDVAIRAVNQAYAVGMILDSPSVTEEFKKGFSANLYQHAWFTFNNQESNYYNNANHYDSNIAALLFFGFIFQKIPAGKRWLSHAKQEFFFEVRQQVLPSGVIYEKSTNYGRLVAEMFTFSYCMLKNHGEYVPQDIEYRIEKQFDFILHYIKPNGHAPIIGDQDDARWLPFTPLGNTNHKHLLSLAALLFNRPDFKQYSNGYSADAFFLIPHKTSFDFEQIDNITHSRSSAPFKDGGFFIMRSDKVYLFINNSGMGKYIDLSYSLGSHTHSDLLSFELAFGQRTFLVDPGTYVYTSNPSERNHFRSTAMHNTLTVDNQDQMVIRDKNLFAYNSHINPQLIYWQSDENKDIFEGQHDGYDRLTDPVTHKRRIHLDKKINEITIIDYLSGSGIHNADLYFHFDTNIAIDIIDNKEVLTSLINEPNLRMVFEAEDVSYTLEENTGWISKQYGKKETARILNVNIVSAQLPLQFTTKIKFEDNDQNN